MTAISDLGGAKLASGGEIPLLGLGTWQLPGNQASQPTADAPAAGYRHSATATTHRNEPQAGAATLVAIADELGRTVPQVIVRWHVQHGFVVIPKSARQDRIVANADVGGFTLTSEQMSRIDGLGG